MKTIRPTDGMTITESVRIEPGVYELPKGITVAADDVVIDGAGALFVGNGRQGCGLRIAGRSNVEVHSLRFAEYEFGIRAEDSRALKIARNTVRATTEIEPNTIFLDIWKSAESSYGGAIYLCRVTDSVVEHNDVQHQMNGILTYHCRELKVLKNQANYNSGFGVHLFDTCDSLFEENSADYCCRFQPREGPLHFGHMGADATGFLALMGSSRNVFRRNWARMGGDGFFLAGLSPKMDKVGCNDNLFEENDASLSPNIAFEATFCSGNVFRGNFADRCNFGFWLGYSWETRIENNRMVMNRQAGIAVEHGHHTDVRGNQFQANGHGVLLWSAYVEAFETVFPESATSHDWTIEENVFTRNGKGIRIAADQDHGIRDLPAERSGRPELRPHHHTIRKNDIQDNRIGVELVRCDHSTVEGNLLNRNVEANLRLDDATEVVARANLGSAGAYL